MGHISAEPERTRIIVWSPVTDTDRIPPFGPELERRLSGIRNPKRRGASCSAWGLLYDILRDAVQNAAFPEMEIPWEVRFTERGKPYFADRPVYFSLSHSGDLCAVSVSESPTGIDVERVREFYSPALIRRVLSARERAAFDGDFTRIWCRKECIAKLTGRGIIGNPAEIDTLDPCRMDDYTFREISLDWNHTAYRLSCAFTDRPAHTRR